MHPLFHLDPIWTLIGIGVIVAGFLARLNPLLVVTVAALVTGVIAGKAPVEVVSAFGKAFNQNRYVTAVWLLLPVIGLLERQGLQQQARRLILSIRAATTGRLLLAYFLFRQITAALGLTSIAGHAQTVRPLIAPMAEGAAEARLGLVTEPMRRLARAYAAATDNTAVFFGEDIFLAVSSIAVITGVMNAEGIRVQPLQLAVWAMPTALMALVIHAVRLRLLDRRLERMAQVAAATEAGAKAEAVQ
jgi:uncharacterized membrane protein